MQGCVVAPADSTRRGGGGDTDVYWFHPGQKGFHPSAQGNLRQPHAAHGNRAAWVPENDHNASCAVQALMDTSDVTKTGHCCSAALAHEGMSLRQRHQRLDPGFEHLLHRIEHEMRLSPPDSPQHRVISS